MTPTIDELFDRYSRLLDDPEIKPNQESFEVYFSGVASGKEKPILLLHNAMLAAQTVMVVFEHVKKMKQSGCGVMSEAKCKRCKELRGVIVDQEVMHQARLSDLVNRSGLDISPCRKCGVPVISIPDGLALCKDCAEKAGE